MYRELFLLQPLMEKLRQRRVIFSDKNAHRQTPDDKFGRGKMIVSVTQSCVNGGSKLDSAKRASPVRVRTNQAITKERPDHA